MIKFFFILGRYPSRYEYFQAETKNKCSEMLYQSLLLQGEIEKIWRDIDNFCDYACICLFSISFHWTVSHWEKNHFSWNSKMWSISTNTLYMYSHIYLFFCFCLNWNNFSTDRSNCPLLIFWAHSVIHFEKIFYFIRLFLQSKKYIINTSSKEL